MATMNNPAAFSPDTVKASTKTSSADFDSALGPADEGPQASEGRWRAILDNSAVGISVTDFRGKFVATNRAYQEMVGYSEEELQSMTYIDLTLEEDRPASAAVASDSWAGRLPQFQLEKRYRRKDGRIIWVRVTVSKSSGSGDTPEIGIAIVEDITERRRAEARLLEYEKVVEGLHEMMVVLDREYRYVVANQAFLNYHGLTREQVVGHFVPEFVGQERFDQVTKNTVDECFRGRVVRCEMELTFPNVGRRDLVGSYYPIKGPEGVDRIAVVLEDVTERKRAEEARTASEVRWRALFDNSAVGISVTDLQGRFIAANRAYQEMVGYSEEELRSVTYADLTHEEDRPASAAFAASTWAVRAPQFQLEKRNLRKDGQPIWVRVTSSTSDPATTPQMCIAIVEDITERKRAEARLLEYEKVVESSQDMITVVDRDYRYLIANQAYLNYRGLKPAQVIGHFVSELTGKEMFDQTIKGKLDECFRGAVVKYEATLRYSGLGWRDLFITYFPIEGPEGIDRIAAVLVDITEHKRAEARLLEYQKVVESSQEMIAVVDRDYRYLIANQTFLDYHGVAREQVVGHFVWEIVGQETFETFTKIRLDECFQGRAVKMESDFTFSKLGRRDLLKSYFPIEGPEGVNRAAVVLQDITERKRAERELQRSLLELHALNAQLQSVREEERTRLAREIHDELGQALTAIKIDLAALKSAPGRAQRPQSIDGIMSRVDETIQSVRRISTELRPGILDHLGLTAAVEWAAEEFQERTGIQCRVGLPGTNPAIDSERATALFRILQETLTNIARHAGATRASIDLSQQGGTVSLEVRDNGRGIGADQISGSASLGILGMRERTALLGGEFIITGDRGSGTTVRVDVPVAHPSTAKGGS
jgi:PAS domain S-box-containing protein